MYRDRQNNERISYIASSSTPDDAHCLSPSYSSLLSSFRSNPAPATGKDADEAKLRADATAAPLGLFGISAAGLSEEAGAAADTLAILRASAA